MIIKYVFKTYKQTNKSIIIYKLQQTVLLRIFYYGLNKIN